MHWCLSPSISICAYAWCRLTHAYEQEQSFPKIVFSVRAFDSFLERTTDCPIVPYPYPLHYRHPRFVASKKHYVLPYTTPEYHYQIGIIGTKAIGDGFAFRFLKFLDFSISEFVHAGWNIFLDLGRVAARASASRSALNYPESTTV